MKVMINRVGVPFVKKGQMWIYRNNVLYVEDHIHTGDIVDVESEDKEYLGTGFYHETSHVAVRLYTKSHETLDQEFFAKRIRFAYEYRKTVERKNLTNCRLIFGEADGLPGLTVDRYNDILVAQITSYGLEMRKQMIYDLLIDVLREDNQTINALYERNDVKVREKEGLPLYKGFYYGEGHSAVITINENGLKLNVDIENGQKTGYFLDQKSNRLLLRDIAYGKKVLDCFSHTGGFALNAALGGASHVTAVDVSQTALDEGHRNAVMNHLEDRIDFVLADVFDYLDTIKQDDFDIIVLDPPAFTKSRKTVMKAYNGYKRINKVAMNALRGGGYLISCSCSRFMEREMYEKMLKEAAEEADVKLCQVSVTQQNKDHPILWTMDETSYLKFYIFRVI